MLLTLGRSWKTVATTQGGERFEVSCLLMRTSPSSTDATNVRRLKDVLQTKFDGDVTDMITEFER